MAIEQEQNGSQYVVGGWSSEPQEQLAVSGVADPAPWLIEALGGDGASASGMRVNQRTVLTSGPVYQAVTMIANDLSTLPLEVFKEGATKDKQDRRHPAWKIFNVRGNTEMLAFHVRQTLLGWCLIHGNAVGVIERAGGMPVGIYPVQPGHAIPQRMEDNTENRQLGIAGEIVYRVTLDDGTTQNFFQQEVFHLKLFGTGLWGYSPLELFRDLFGNGLAMERFQGKNFANSARPSGVLKKTYGQGIPRELSPLQKRNLREDFEKLQSGVDNTGRIALLSGGLEWVPMSVTPEQAQMIDSLKYHREQVAAVYNLPPHKLGAMENSAVRANIEEQNRSYVQGTLMPIATMFEQESQEKLCSNREKARGACIIRHNFKAPLRADSKTRHEAYAIGRQWGWLSANDVRDLEDLDQIGEQGDVYMIPANMMDASKTNEPPPEPAPLPAPPGAAPEPPEPDEAAEDLMRYARRTLRDKQRIEIDNLKRGILEKEPFDQFCMKYYARFAAAMLEPLEPLTTVAGFVDDGQLQQLVGDYVSTSYQMVHQTATPGELLDVVVYFPQRVDALLDQLRKEPR